jgi:hypothetical protein
MVHRWILVNYSLEKQSNEGGWVGNTNTWGRLPELRSCQ